MKKFTYVEFVKFQKSFIEKIKAQGKSRNTIGNYKTDFRTFGEFTKRKNIRPHIFNFSMIYAKEYLYYLDSEYPSANSRRRKVQSMRIFYDFLLERKKVEKNPFKMLPTAPKVLNIPEPNTIKEMNKLWAEFNSEEKNSNPRISITAKRNRCVFLLIVGCNLRPSEIANLSKADIIISGSVGRVMIKSVDNEPYTIPIPSDFIGYFKKYIKDFTNTVQNSGNKLFFGTNGKAILNQKLLERGVQKIFQRYSKKLKIKCTPKMLRQSCILRWINSDMPEATIKTYMGVEPVYDISNYKQVKNNWNLELKFTA